MLGAWGLNTLMSINAPCHCSPQRALCSNVQYCTVLISLCLKHLNPSMCACQCMLHAELASEDVLCQATTQASICLTGSLHYEGQTCAGIIHAHQLARPLASRMLPFQRSNLYTFITDCDYQVLEQLIH